MTKQDLSWATSWNKVEVAGRRLRQPRSDLTPEPDPETARRVRAPAVRASHAARAPSFDPRPALPRSRRPLLPRRRMRPRLLGGDVRDGEEVADAGLQLVIRQVREPGPRGHRPLAVEDGLVEGVESRGRAGRPRLGIAGPGRLGNAGHVAGEAVLLHIRQYSSRRHS